MNEVKFKNGTKLSDVMSFLPHGVINKTETGIGATTLEAICRRNSIIVEPTRAIVSAKSEVHGCIGFMSGVTVAQVEEYLSSKKDDFKKFFVVSDSTGKLISILKELGEDVFNSYHFLVDEGEQYQTEAGFRVGMGIALDYYKEFPLTNRTFTSAFLYKFSNPFFAAEPSIKYSYNEPTKRNVSLKITNNPILETIAVLNQLKGKNLIFFSSVEGINNIIQLGAFPKEDCAVYCGEGSIDKVSDFYQGFTSTPSHKYNFYTSAYYSGIDIFGEYNVITVVDVTKIHTLLYPSKLKQIAGRVRTGILNDIIISSYAPNLEQKYSDYVEARLKDANDAIAIVTINKEITNNKWFNNIKAGIIKQEFDGVLITREDKDGNVVPNYEEIDNKYLHIRSGTELYSTANGLMDYLIQDGNIVHYTNTQRAFSQNDIYLMKSYIDKIDDDRLKVTNMVYNFIKTEEAKGQFNFATLDFRQLMHESTGTAKRLLTFYIECRDVEALKKSKGNERFIADYLVAYSFKKLNGNHKYKSKMVAAFPVKLKLTSEEIGDKINKINSEEIPGSMVMSKVQALKHLKKFYKVKRCKISSKAEDRIDGHQIVKLAA